MVFTRVLTLLLLALGGYAHAATWTLATFDNVCGNATTAPQIFANTLVTPPALNGGTAPAGWNAANGRIDRQGIRYVAGGGLRFELVTDRCTYIKQVKVGQRVVTPTYTDGFWYSAQDSTSQPSDPTRYGYNLWIFFPPIGDGSTDTVSITVGRSAGAGEATYSFPMVYVKRVEASYVNAPIGFSRAEIHNMFAKALYAKFNGATNSTTITSTDGSKRRIYGYDPASLSVTIDSSGVGFQFKFKTDIANWCDPTLRAYGKFKLDANLSGIALVWVSPAEGSASWPTLCSATQLVPILGLIPTLIQDVIEGRASNSLRSTIEEAVLKELPDTSNVLLFLNGSITRTNELQVNLRLPAPSVAFNVPYDVFDLNRNATAFASGEVVALLASGLGVNDYAAGVSPQTTLYSGPNGVPLFGTTPFPNSRTLSRINTSLPVPGAPVARLLARTSSPYLGTTTLQYTPGCAISAGSIFTGGKINFGVNDTVADAQRLRGYLLAAPGYMLRAVFVTQIAPTTTRCQGVSTGGIVFTNTGTLLTQ